MGRPLELELDRGRHAEFGGGFLDRCDSVAKRGIGPEVERNGRGGKLADVIDEERGRALRDAGDARQRHGRSGAGPHEKPGERGGTGGEAWIDFEHDAILARLGEQRGNLALAVGAVERVIDVGHADAEAAGGVAVDLDEGLQPLVLLVAHDIGESGLFPQTLDQRRYP